MLLLWKGPLPAPGHRDGLAINDMPVRPKDWVLGLWTWETQQHGARGTR